MGDDQGFSLVVFGDLIPVEMLRDLNMLSFSREGDGHQKNG